MSSWHKVTIEKIIDCEAGKQHDSREFIASLQNEPHKQQKLRILLENVRETPSEFKIICGWCHKPTMLRGSGFEQGTRSKKRLHFTHAFPNAKCPYQNGNVISKVELNRRIYHGLREGPEHRMLKERLAKCLLLQKSHVGDVEYCEIEKVIRSDESTWKKPDINFGYKGIRVALEIQLSTTYLDVINDRHRFYKAEGIYMLWVFNSLSLSEYDREFAKNDVIFNNNGNAYVFEHSDYSESNSKQVLHLNCYYLVYYFDTSTHRIEFVWKSQQITLSDLIFDEDNGGLYFFDSEKSLSEAKLKAKQFEEKEANKRKRAKDLKFKIDGRKTEIITLNREINLLSQKLNVTHASLSSLWIGYRRTQRYLFELKQLDKNEIYNRSKIALPRLADLKNQADNNVTKQGNLERQIDEISKTVNRELDRITLLRKAKLEFVIDDVQYVDISKMFDELFYLANWKWLYGRNRLSQVATKYFPSNYDLLKYDLNNNDSTLIFMDRELAVELLNEEVLSKMESVKDLKMAKDLEIENFVLGLISKHLEDIENFRIKYFNQNKEKRSLKKQLFETVKSKYNKEGVISGHESELHDLGLDEYLTN